jgi:hypothetical protein
LYSRPASASYEPNTSGVAVATTMPPIARSNAAPSSLFGEPNVVG